MAECLGSGLIGKQVDQSWQRRNERLKEGVDPITGVTDFASAEEEPLSRPARRPPEVAAAAARRLSEYRAERGSLDILLAESGVEQVETGVQAASSGATLGELTAALERDGDSLTITRFPIRRDSEPFEDQG